MESLLKERVLDNELEDWLRGRLLEPLGIPRASRMICTSASASHRAIRCSCCGKGDSRLSFIIKAYYLDEYVSEFDIRSRIRREIRSFNWVKKAGLFEGKNRVARLLGVRMEKPAVIVIEDVGGKDLASLIKNWARDDKADDGMITSGIEGAAAILAGFHSVRDFHIETSRRDMSRYPLRLLEKCLGSRVIAKEKFKRLTAIYENFRDLLDNNPKNLVHGDANPANFILRPDKGVTAIDLERVGTGAPALDAGFLIADIIHLSKQYGASYQKAQHLAGTFEKAYEKRRETPLDPLEYIIYVSIGLLRIARISWLAHDYRKGLMLTAEKVIEAADKGYSLQSINNLW